MRREIVETVEAPATKITRMKIIKWISHPVVVCFTFCMIFVSGDHFGGVYLLYILMALPQGGLHAILAISGISILAGQNTCAIRFSYAVNGAGYPIPERSWLL